MGATNRPQELDEAVLRYLILLVWTHCYFTACLDFYLSFKPSRRFPKRIYVAMPDTEVFTLELASQLAFISLIL